MAASLPPIVSKDWAAARCSTRKTATLCPGDITATGSYSISFNYSNVRVVAAYVIPDADLAADNSNYFTFQLTNRGLTGGGTTTLLATAVNTTVASGTSALAYEHFMVTPDQNQELAKGSVLSFEVVESGTATLSNPSLVVEYQENL